MDRDFFLKLNILELDFIDGCTPLQIQWKLFNFTLKWVDYMVLNYISQMLLKEKKSTKKLEDKNQGNHP